MGGICSEGYHFKCLFVGIILNCPVSNCQRCQFFRSVKLSSVKLSWCQTVRQHGGCQIVPGPVWWWGCLALQGEGLAGGPRRVQLSRRRRASHRKPDPWLSDSPWKLDSWPSLLGAVLNVGKKWKYFPLTNLYIVVFLLNLILLAHNLVLQQKFSLSDLRGVTFYLTPWRVGSKSSPER